MKIATKTANVASIPGETNSTGTNQYSQEVKSHFDDQPKTAEKLSAQHKVTMSLRLYGVQSYPYSYIFSKDDARELIQNYPESSVVKCPLCGGSGKLQPLKLASFRSGSKTPTTCPLFAGSGQAVRIPPDDIPNFKIGGS